MLLSRSSITYRPTLFLDNTWSWKKTQNYSKSGWKMFAMRAQSKHQIAINALTIGARSFCKINLLLIMLIYKNLY